MAYKKTLRHIVGPIHNVALCPTSNWGQSRLTGIAENAISDWQSDERRAERKWHSLIDPSQFNNFLMQFFAKRERFVRGEQNIYSRTDAEIELLFRQFLRQWRQETMMKSDQVTILTHPAHYRIIGLGRQVLRYIFEDLAAGGGPWFVALEALTLKNPVSEQSRRKASLMREDWLTWGRENGYVAE